MIRYYQPCPVPWPLVAPLFAIGVLLMIIAIRRNLDLLLLALAVLLIVFGGAGLTVVAVWPAPR